ncbi:MBL fold metallo-hydrolase [Pseudomonas sp. ML96]|uniref:MBL fold metallo-hydrolase n=1 Tax=Pseudomonas sp. ML96 TaxID=1523503 RepID=UPI0009DF097E|nr:MBL fold metallo-hydrolase [Pseudomonas sp. ML96]
MSYFVALPVAGDAFLLRRSEHDILVDGGKSSVRLAKALAEHNVDHLDIVVCTHADYDHAGGLVDLLDRTGISVGEFWLPGAWAESLTELLTTPAEVVGDLVNSMEKLVLPPVFEGAPTEFEELMHSYVSDTRREYRAKNGEIERDKPSPSAPDREELEPRVIELPFGVKSAGQAAKAFQSGRSRVRHWGAKRKTREVVATFWLGLIDTAERIRRIAVQAAHHRVPVRWFDFGEFEKTRQAAGGYKDLLIPLNAVELASPPPPAGLSFLVRLTPINEECLVFLSPSENWDLPSFVFTGDSPLGSGVNYSSSWLQWPEDASRRVIATAPHHGSESNFSAYKHLADTVDVELWVRSGGTPRHPGPTYRQLSPAFRICTHCPRRGKPLQAALIHFESGYWWRYPETHIRTHGHFCNC